MTNETKRIFDAPWEVADDKDEQGRYMTIDNNMACVAKESTLKDANRHASLPELYDKLMWAVVQYCPDAFLTLDECRLCHDKKCKYREIIELLRKVRNGE